MTTFKLFKLARRRGVLVLKRQRTHCSMEEGSDEAKKMTN